MFARRPIALLALALVFLLPGCKDDDSAPTSPPSPEGTVVGVVVDGNDQPRAGVVVIMCSADTGIPIHAPTGVPVTRLMTETNDEKAMNEVLRVVTDADGRFVFRQSPPGRFRLVAQRRPKVEKSPDDLFEYATDEIELCGVVDDVEVPSSAARSLRITPLGNVTLRIEQPEGSSSDLMILSRAPLAADPILGFASWSGDFLRRAIAVNRPQDAKTTFHGLPNDVVYLAHFANDNNPGFSGGAIDVRTAAPGPTGLPVIASWSNGHKTPPPRLEALVEELRAHEGNPMIPVMSQVPTGTFAPPARNDKFGLWSRLVPHLDLELKTAKGTKTTFADYVATMWYLRLQKGR